MLFLRRSGFVKAKFIFSAKVLESLKNGSCIRCHLSDPQEVIYHDGSGGKTMLTKRLVTTEPYCKEKFNPS